MQSRMFWLRDLSSYLSVKAFRLKPFFLSCFLNKKLCSQKHFEKLNSSQSKEKQNFECFSCKLVFDMDIVKWLYQASNIFTQLENF